MRTCRRRAKKTTIAKRKVSTPAVSSPKVEMAPPSSAASPAAAVEDTTGSKEGSFLKKDQTRKPDPIMTAGSAIESDSAKDGESSQPDPAIRARPAKKRVVAKVAASTVRKEAASVARDEIGQKTGSLSEKEAETEKSEASKDGRDCTVEEPIEGKSMKEALEVNVGEEKERAGDGDIKTVKEGEENTVKTGGEKEIEEIPVSQEVKDEGEKIEKIDTEELASEVKIEEQLVKGGELIEEEAMEEVEPIEEEAVEGEPIEEEAVEEGESIEEDSVEEVELIEEEPLGEEEEAFEEEEEEEPTEQEQVEEEPMEEEEEEQEEEEEEPIEEEVGEGDGNEEIAKGRNNEEKREIAAVKDVQLASVDGEGEGEDQGLGDMAEPILYMKALLPNRKVKDTQIFISQLERTVVEQDIVKVFAGFGEIQSVRVIRHSKTQKSKGYAFLQYSTAEAVEKALSQLKDGTEIKGRTVHISVSNQENCTLIVGNICKSWSKDQVLDALKGLGVEEIDQIALPEDPKVEGKIKGFAFVEFCTHIDAKAALKRLCRPDAVLGCDYSAKVSFAQFSVNYTEDIQAKVKTVYLDPVPPSWDGKKIEEICKEYGAIEKIKLYRNSKTRRKDFAFVEFVSRESAMNCVSGLSKALVDRDDTKVSASMARPYAKKTGTKFMIRGNFKVKKSNEKGEKEEARIIKKNDEKVEKEEVKIIEVSGDSKKKRKRSRPKSKGVIAQKSNALSPQKTINKNKMVHKKGPNIETPKETPHQNAPKKKPNKEAPVPVHPQGSRKRPFKEAPESSKRPFKGKMKHEKGMRGGPHPHQSGTKKLKPLKGSKQHQRGALSFNKERGAPAFNNERDFKRPRNDHYGDYHSHGPSPIDRRLSLEYAYAPPSYTRHIHEPPYASTSSMHEPPHNASMCEPSRREPYPYASGSYHSHHSDLAPHAGYVPPTHHAPRTRHVYEPSAPAPAPYGGGYDRPIVYTREPPIPPTTHPGFVTYPRYQQPSYPYPTGRSYPADYPPRRSYY